MHRIPDLTQQEVLSTDKARCSFYTLSRKQRCPHLDLSIKTSKGNSTGFFLGPRQDSPGQQAKESIQDTEKTF